MADQRFVNAFNDCIDRLANGETIAECLRRYPEYAIDLRPMLEAGLLARRAESDSAEVLAAKMRVRAQLFDALALTPPRRSTSPMLRVLPLVASVLIVFAFAIVGGSALLSRLNQVDPTPTVELLSTETPTPTMTATPTLTATVTPSPSSTVSPTASLTPSSTPTETTVPTLPSTNTPRPTNTVSPTLTPSPDPTNEITGCSVAIPAGWIIHRIQSGDTLSSLAARGGTSLNELLRVNCLAATSIIVVGQRIYVPPLSPATALATTGAPAQSGGGNTGGGASDNGNDAGNDNGVDDNSNDNGDDHGGSGGGGNNNNGNDDD